MAPNSNPFWREVRAQATAGTVVVLIGSIFAGIVYLVHTVPRQLDQVIDNQLQFRGRLEKVEQKVDDQDSRLIRLESRRQP